jgi:putative transposase
MIRTLSVEYAIKECCEALGVSRSGYYQWKQAEPTQREREEAELVKQIRRVFEANKGRYGSPRVSQALRQDGIECGENRVARLMRENELAARRKKAFRPRTTVPGKGTAPNLIKDLEPSAVDQIWVSDITYVATVEGWLYLAVILDLFSRKVVGWKLGETLEAELVETALANALLMRAPDPGLYFHSDRGSQYSSQAVRKPLSVIGANLSMSGQGNCYDNAKAEAFFSTLKTECFPPNQFFGSKAFAARSSNTSKFITTIGVCTARLVIRRRASLKPAIVKEETTFSKQKFQLPFFRMRNVVQESKRNKWRVARREAPFMPACELECSAAF